MGATRAGLPESPDWRAMSDRYLVSVFTYVNLPTFTNTVGYGPLVILTVEVETGENFGKADRCGWKRRLNTQFVHPEVEGEGFP